MSTNTIDRNVLNELGNKVKLTDYDKETGLELFCYVKCETEDEHILQQVRGIVFHEEQVVMKAFPYTLEYSEEETDVIKQNIGNVFDKCSFYESYEGALIRMF